jgi:hypothetical protein
MKASPDVAARAARRNVSLCIFYDDIAACCLLIIITVDEEGNQTLIGK